MKLQRVTYRNIDELKKREAELTLEMAKDAMGKVLGEWGGEIPKSLHRVKADNIFKFHSTKASYDIAFASSYVRTFRPAEEGGCVRKQSIKPTDHTATGVAGFVTAERRNRDRTVHVQPGILEPPHIRPDDPVALLAHEYIHWLSHPNFYPEHYKTGKKNVFQVEGCTEWMMVQCFSGRPVTLSYNNEYLMTNAWIQTAADNWKKMASFVFDGEVCDLSALNR